MGGISESLWADGRTEREFEESGLECFTRTHPAGHRCGYVVVRNGHPLYGLDIEKMYERYDLDVDGGVTYANGTDDFWLIGWDAAHAWHRRDESIMDDEYKKLYAGYPTPYGGILWPTYVVDADGAEIETRRLARQIAEIGA